MIVRQLRWGIVLRKFGRLDESKRSSSSKRLGEGGENRNILLQIYVSLRIYLAISGLLPSSLTNPFNEDAMRWFWPTSWSSMVANRCLLQIWWKAWETRVSFLRRSLSSFPPTISMIRAMLSKGKAEVIVVERWTLSYEVTEYKIVILINRTSVDNYSKRFLEVR